MINVNVLVDSNVILDIFTNDPKWINWSQQTLDKFSHTHTLCINPIIYTEVSIGFDEIETFEQIIEHCEFKLLELPKPALFLAGKTFVKYRQQKGTKSSTLPDFYIGAHAQLADMQLITRDIKRYGTYFPKVTLIAPQ